MRGGSAMGTVFRAVSVAIVAALFAAAGPHRGAAAAEDKLKQRVRVLLAALADPEARGANLKQAVAAREELARIGGPAAPQLVEAAVTNPASSNVGYTAGQILVDIGKPALPAIRARWADLNDERRWRLVPALERHDCASVRDYAHNCLDSDGPVRLAAWQFMFRTKDPRAADRYFDALGEGGKEPPYVRWSILPGDRPIFDEKRENTLLLYLLEPESWVAKGEGQPPPLGPVPPWWPDGRPHVIRSLHQRKVAAAAPGLLRVLEEKGRGAGYLAELIIPALADLGHKEAIPELMRIAACEPGPGQPGDRHPHALGGYKAVRQLAADAVIKLRPPGR